MKLLTKAIEKKLPALYAQDGKGTDAMVFAKFFNPCGSATWYATEYDPEEGIFFGHVDLFGDGGELGYFSLEELKSITLPFGMKIERDKYFTPKPLKEIL